jgi:cytoskeletal protein RodZ
MLARGATGGSMSEGKLTLGQYFKQEREKLGLDLRQIEERTKISFQILTFLENDQLDVLPRSLAWTAMR